MEIQVAKWLKQNPKQAQSKPIAAMIVGRAAPKNRIMGHAGSYWELPEETADYKRKLLAEAGVAILNTPEQLARNLKVSIHIRGIATGPSSRHLTEDIVDRIAYGDPWYGRQRHERLPEYLRKSVL